MSFESIKSVKWNIFHIYLSFIVRSVIVSQQNTYGSHNCFYPQAPSFILGQDTDHTSSSLYQPLSVCLSLPLSFSTSFLIYVLFVLIFWPFFDHFFFLFSVKFITYRLWPKNFWNIWKEEWRWISISHNMWSHHRFVRNLFLKIYGTMCRPVYDKSCK